MSGTPRQDQPRRDAVDGAPLSLRVKLPKRIHITAGVIFVVLVGLSLASAWDVIDIGLKWDFSKTQIDFTALISIVSVIFVFYSVYYAKRSIEMNRDRDRRFRTIEYSMRFSSGPVSEARDAIYRRHNGIRREILERKMVDPTTFEIEAIQELAAVLQTALVNRGTDGNTSRGFRELAPNAAQAQSIGHYRQTDDKLVSHVRLLLDMFEDLAVGIEEGVFDERISNELLAGLILNYWRQFSRFVDNHRDASSPQAYKHFQALVDKWSA
jgi:hypothetical protein